MRTSSLFGSVFLLLAACSADAGSHSESAALREPTATVPRDEEPNPGRPEGSAEAAPPTEADDSCFPAGVASRSATVDVSEHWHTITKIFMVGSRLGFVHGDEITTMPVDGGGMRTALLGGNISDAFVSGNRVYTLESSGTINWYTPMLDWGNLVNVDVGMNATAMHVDDESVYYVESQGYAAGTVRRTDRDRSSSAAPVLTGALSRWMSGTQDNLFVFAYGDLGNTSWGELARMPKNGDPGTVLLALSDARPAGLVVDANGVVIAETGEYGAAPDEIGVIGQDGTGFARLLTAPAGTIAHLAANAESVYYVAEDRTLMRVPRAGGAPAPLAQATYCRITAVSTEGGRLHVATAANAIGTSRREVWRIGQ